jgi:hypothetical protein
MDFFNKKLLDGFDCVLMCRWNQNHEVKSFLVAIQLDHFFNKTFQSSSWDHRLCSFQNNDDRQMVVV